MPDPAAASGQTRSPSADRVALVAGATGIVGSGLAQRLVADGWRVLCASRAGSAPAGAEGIALDLMDAGAARRVLADHPGITHVFYAAYVQAANRAAEVAPNLAMLRHAVEAVDASAPGLRRVVLVTGAKYYGIQWGPTRTPCRETDPRQLPPNFYYDQEDFLRAAQAGKRWSWVNLIPPFVSGYAVGNPMNLVLGIGLYAAVCKELGLPLRYPGSAAAYASLHQIADARQIAAAASWAATSDTAANERFNVTNGDPVRWQRSWPRLAEALGMAVDEPKTLPLVDVMPAQQAVWDRIVQRHDLRPIELARVVDWGWVDYMLRMAHDVLLETGKLRRAGFGDSIATEEVLVERLRELQAARVLPK